MAFNRNKTFTKCQKVANKLNISKVVADISGPCEEQGTPHTCLHAFRLQPGAALQWRKLWYALPKQDRETRLVDEFANAFKAHTSAHYGDKANFHVQFRLFGSQVCRGAFIALTGIHAGTLQMARQIARGGRPPTIATGLQCLDHASALDIHQCARMACAICQDTHRHITHERQIVAASRVSPRLLCGVLQ